MEKTNLFKISKEHRFGLEIENGKLNFLTPKELYFNSDNVFKQLEKMQAYTNILFKYYKSKKKSICDSEISNVSNSLEYIQGLINILNDYIQNDYFKIKLKSYGSQNKRINWNQTFKRGDFIISNNKVIYSSFISSEKRDDTYSDFYKLYLNSLNIASQTLLNESLFETQDINFSETQILYIINCFMDEHFSDRDVFIAQALKSFYLGSNNILKNECFDTPFHEKFEYIWEFLIENIIPDNNNHFIDSNLNKEGSYYSAQVINHKIIKGEKISNGLSYKIDHVIYLKNKKFISILDSKFYDFYKNSDLSPKTESIGKQVHYRDLLNKKVNNNVNILNFFIFPKNELLNKEIELFAIHNVKNDKNFNIYCLALDIEIVISLFNKKRKYNELIDYLLIFKDE